MFEVDKKIEQRQQERLLVLQEIEKLQEELARRSFEVRFIEGMIDQLLELKRETE